MNRLITFRRWYIDQFLSNSRPLFSGVILDIGGERVNKRGMFLPPLDLVDQWIVVNTNDEELPDINASADKVPMEDEVADVVVLTELLEHVEQPHDVLKEVARLLKTNGTLLITMPFLYQVHGDPLDFNRWTDEMMRRRLVATGFQVESLHPMGGIFAVIYDLIRAHIYRTHSVESFSFRTKVRLIQFLVPIFKALDKESASTKFITTGWAVVAKKI